MTKLYPAYGNLLSENEFLKEQVESLSNQLLEKGVEMDFLRERNRELRQKTYINVYDENLKMQDEIKALKHENQVKFNDLVKYEKTIDQLRNELMQVGAIADKYYQDAIRLNEENNKLNGVIGSVQTFIGQFAK